MLRRLLLILTLGSILALVVLNLDPVTTKLHRLAILCAMLGIWLGPVILSWKRKAVRYALLPIPFLIAIPFTLPAKPIDREALRSDFIKRMRAYQGTKYHWGGENARGIDCSGLPRKTMRDALFSNGISNLDGGSLRKFLDHWWHDTSAKALAEGYRDFTISTGETGTIEKLDHSKLEPGDLAVTEDRTHILAYLGGENWIQADPGAGKVIIENGRTSQNGWFGVPVTTHRWSFLSTP